MSAMSAGTPIASVRPLRDGLIWVDFESGSQVLLDMKSCLGALRFKAQESPDGQSRRRVHQVVPRRYARR